MMYLREVRDRHGYIHFLGLPQLKDNPDVPIQRLYVEPNLWENYVHPDRDPKEWPKCKTVLETVAESQRLVVLGDPGSGKSTLVSWLSDATPASKD